ncbi:ABC transporter substrate-binding protein [Paenibacillus cremeus]|uniref:Extracellular solute-binding protein n=1 Tax=Paenibacillus cremeus TaxID=2163881 RepID=A0A559K6J4_9BACL|nr:extracellular solute-binding protein [Paenibacillus cremeus]TVY07758.1 extracellular solute-binding protein [Paenibacillus cremeus]
MLKKTGISILASALVLASLTACSSGQGTQGAAPKEAPKAEETKATPPPASNEPVTLTITNHKSVGFTESDFQKYFVEPVKKKYPNITLQYIKPTQGQELEDLVAAGNTPDLIFASNGYFALLKQLDVMQDLNEYVKKYNVDLSIYDQPIMERIRQAGDKGELYSIPFSLNYGMMLYNKDIFDKFGLPYPKDIMSFEDILPIAKKINRTENGIQYIGFEPNYADTIAGQLGVPAVLANDKPTLDLPEYKRVFDFMKQVYDIPGQIGPGDKFNWGRNGFLKDQNVAMFLEWSNDAAAPLEEAAKGGFTNWDIAALPNFQDKLGNGRTVDSHMTFISKTSKHKEEAFKVLLETVSKETQMIVSANGRISAIPDKAIQANYAKNFSSYNGKKVQNIFLTKQTPAQKSSIYGSKASSIIRDEQKNMALGKKDVNTALKDAQERVIKNVEEEKKK